MSAKQPMTLKGNWNMPATLVRSPEKISAMAMPANPTQVMKEG
ncbi:MAG: hypothetical protein BWY57_00582 [Betaproteobacteria bacterium ADurb.Bin341]|nr:MAG: hypothetical protein BWY57_00582 [Betaproteobacteria bacterium ADurb.Bin341]